MIAANRETALKAKHESLEAAIHGERQRPKPDDALIAQMKKQKLSIKQELHA